MSAARRVLPSLVLALLLGATILAVQPAEAYPVSAAQKSTVESRFGSGAPFTSWQSRVTTDTFYLHSDPTGSAGPPPVKYTNGPAVPNPRLDAVAPVGGDAPATMVSGQAAGGGNQAAIGVAPGAATFPVIPDLTAKDEIEFYGIGATVFVSCNFANPMSTSGAPQLATVRATFSIQESKDGGVTWAPRASNPGIGGFNMNHGANQGAAPNVVTSYSGSSTVGDITQLNGPKMQAGERLVVSFNVAFNTNSIGTISGVGDPMCILHYDSGGAASRVTVRTNAMRAALLTTNTEGDHLTAFPSAGLAGEHRFVVEALQATAFGSHLVPQMMAKHANLRLWDQDAQAYLYYMDDNPNDNECGSGCSLEYPRDYSFETVKLVSSRTAPLTPEPEIEADLGNGILRRSYVFSYDTTLPDHKIEPQFYSFPTVGDNWELRGNLFGIGGKGFSFGLRPGETKVHEVNPGETTEFSFVVNNTGTADDTITVAAGDLAGGWTARVLGGGKYAVRAGGFSFGTVEVIPPPSATSGQTTVVLTASSSFGDVPNAAAISLTTRLTNAVERGLNISTETDVFAVQPGVTKGYPVTVQNLGTARDSVVIVPSFPSNIQGWSIRANPSSAQIVAGGFSDIQLLITPPASAAGGTSFPLGLSVVEVGNSSVGDRVDVTVQVTSASGVLASLLDANTGRAMREDAPDACVDGTDPLCETGTPIPDTDFDNTGLFRIDVTNQGDQPARYKVESFWDLSVPGSINEGTCDDVFVFGATIFASYNDGVPDGWRFNYGTGVGDIPPVGSPPLPADANSPVGDHGFPSLNNGFSGYYNLNSSQNPLVVPPHTTTPIYFELGWLDGDPCPANDAVGLGEADTAGYDVLSPVAGMTAIVTNLDDPSESSRQLMKASVAAPGAFLGTNRYASAAHAVDIGPAPDQALLAATGLASSASYEMVAINKGNEHDGLRIAVTGHPNWRHEVVVHDNVPAAIACDAPTNGGASVLCPRVGVFDEVRFRVVATPTDKVAVGDRDAMTVTVFSTDAPGLFDTQPLTARAAGTLAFAASPLGDTERSVAAGQSVAFPILIENQGTQDDSYRVTITQAESAWGKVVSTSAPVFIPAGYSAPAYILVTAPDTAAVGSTGDFTVLVESVGSIARRTFGFVAEVIPPSNLVLEGKDGQDVLLGGRDTFETVNVTATKLTDGAGDTITFTVDEDSLPADWTVEDLTIEDTLESVGSGLPKATATFRVKAPADALGNGRAILHVTAVTSGNLAAATDIGMNLVSTQGVLIEALDNKTQVIAPGGPALYNLTVSNLGLGLDEVLLTNSALPAGWTLVLSPPNSALGPLQSIDATAKLTAPVTAKPGDIASVVVFASSKEDPAQISSTVLRAQVGFNAFKLEAVGPVPAGAPQEAMVRVTNVTNTGTLPDEIQLSSKLDTTGLANGVSIQGGPVLFPLAPGQTVQVVSEVTLSDKVPSDSTVQWTLIGKSLLDARPLAQRANASIPLVFTMLPYVANTVNDDSIVEYAVDRNDDATDGFEEFRASTTPGAKPLQTAQMESFLRDEARETPCGTSPCVRDVTMDNGTTKRVLVYTIDGDDDGKVDHFLDKDGDGQPDFYWDPDANKASPIGFRKDINGDQVPESFVDTSGDGEQDAVFDLTRGTFTAVLKVDVDGDCQLKDEDGEPALTAAQCLDYVIDKNGNGEVDSDETVLYTRSGGLLIVQIVDVDGDGKDDQVFDTDGDGNPDYFIPGGTDQSVEITMRDVNGDGTQDWTFDGDNDGRKESYYDPVTGRAHVIDAAGHFGDALRQYWYVGALFALVLVLFVALVMVTRR